MKQLSIEEKAKRYGKAILWCISTIEHEFGCKVIEGFAATELKSWLEKQGNLVKYYEDKLDRCACNNFNKGYKKALEKQGNLMKALQISNAKIGELIEKNYYLKEQLEKQGNNMGISEATKQKLEDNLNKALEKETPESCNEFLDKQGEQKPVIKMKTPEESLGIDSDTYNKIVDECVYGEQNPIKEHNACEFCEDRYGCVSPCSMKLIEKEKHADKIESRQEKLTEFEKAVKQVMEESIECGDTHNLKADADMLLRLVQKSSWSEEDIELLDNTIKFIEDSVAATPPSLRTYNPTLTGKEIPFLKALKDRVQPKQEWSEEDNRMCKAIIDNIQAICEEGYFVGNIDKGELIEWLNSLKDRVQPQKQKWSDVDKDILFRTIDNLKFLRDTISIDPKYAINIIDIEREITWLNSLRPQNKTYYWTENEIKFAISDFIRGAESYEKMIEKLRCLKPQTTWKPSGEQMERLKGTINSLPHQEVLYSLYQDLKKLREE